MRPWSRLRQNAKQGWLGVKIRLRLAIRILHWLMGPLPGFLPLGVSDDPDRREGIIPTIPEVLLPGLAGRALPSLLEIRQIEGPIVEHYDLGPELPRGFRRHHAFEELNFYRVRDAGVGAKSGACRVDGHWLAESFGPLVKWFGWGAPVEAYLKREEHPGLEAGPVTVLESTGYYHFLIEEAPRLLRTLKEEPSTVVVLAEGAPAYEGEFLAILRANHFLSRPPLRLEPKLYHVPEYVFTSAQQEVYFTRQSNLVLLRDCVVPKEPAAQSRCLYLSRARSSRSLANEKEVEEELLSRGFEVLYLETLPWAEQVRAFREAKLVVGQHGAGLANVVFCQPGVTLLELFAKYRRDLFARIVVTSGGSYRYLTCHERDGGWEVSIGELRREIDTWVDGSATGLCAGRPSGQ